MHVLWYRGWWERLIKAALKKTLGRANVSLIALETLVEEVEAVLKDRPLIDMHLIRI